MANAEEILLGLKLKTDEGSIDRAKTRLADLAQAQKDLSRSFSAGDIDANKATKALGAIENEANKLNKELDKLNVPRELRVNEESLKAAEAKAAGGGGILNEVTAGGAGGANNLSSIGRNIRYLPSVRVPGLGVGTDTFGRGAEVLGKLGVSVGQLAVAAPIAGVAIVAMGLALKNFTDNAKKQADELNAVVGARRSVGEDVAKGLTSDAANTQLEEINRQRAAEATLLADLKSKYDANITSQNGLVETVLRLTPQEQALADQIKKSEDAVTGFNTEQTALEKALQDGSIAANDAAAAEKELAAARTQGIISDATQAGDLEAIRQRGSRATQEQIDTEKRGIEDKIGQAQAELASLQANSDGSEEVKKKIDDLTTTIAHLGEQAALLDTLRSSAKTDEQVSREKALESARTASARATDDAYQSELSKAQAGTDALKAERKAAADRRKEADKASRDSISAAAKRGQQEQDETQKAKQQIQDANQKYNDDLSNLATKFNQEQEQSARKAQFDLLKIDRDGKRDEQKAAQDRNFAALADARENVKNQKSDLKDQLRFDANEHQIAYRQQQADLRHNLDNQLRDLNNSYQQQANMQGNFLQSSINAWVGYFNTLARAQARATGTNTGQANNQTLMNQLQYVQGA
jgi:colicin import membrane protein